MFPGTSTYCPNAPSGAIIPVQVHMQEPAGSACLNMDRDNIANFTFHAASNNVTNTDADIVAIPNPPFVQYPASK